MSSTCLLLVDAAQREDQRAAIFFFFVLPPEAHPPGASSPGARPAFPSLEWDAPAARTEPNDGLAEDNNHRGPFFRSGTVLRLHGDHQAHPETQQGRVQ